jgi:tetratricopeptide (TPR) repeat protein
MDVSQMREALQVLGAIESSPPSRAASPDRKSPASARLPSPTPSFFQLARDAQEARRLGKFEQSIVLYRQALATGTKSVELKKAALINLALSMEGMGDVEAAEAQFEVALSFCREADDLQGQAEVHSHLGVLMEKASRYADAERQHNRAFTIFHEKLTDSRGQSIAASNLGSLSSAMGRPRDALKWHLLALEALTRAADSKPSPADYSTCYSHIGMLHYDLGDVAQATVYYVRDYEVCVALGADLATTVAAGKRLVSLLLAGDRLEDALARLEHLSELVTATSDELHEKYVRLREVLEVPPAAPHGCQTVGVDSVYEETGQRESVDDTLALLEEAEALQVEILVEAGLLFSVAQQWAKAEAAYEQVLVILEEYEDLRSYTSDVLMRLGQIALNRGRPEVR